jgi:hypothetical protein
LKYDFVVHPGGNPSDIRMRYEGVEELHVDLSGDLNIHTELGVFADSELFIYQHIDQVENTVEGRFKILDSMTYGFELLGNYDKNKNLVIDPLLLLYSTFIGGSDHDYGGSIAIDSSDSVYVTGGTYSSDFPTTFGAYDISYNTGGDVVVFKLDPTGSTLLYSTFIGGSAQDWGEGIAIDPSGNAYVAGWTDSFVFPTTTGAYDPSYNGDVDVFVLKLNPTGSTLLYSTYVGGNNGEQGLDIAIDSNNNVYVTGVTFSPGFPKTTGAYDTSYNGKGDAFVFKLNPTGSALIYSTFIGGSEYEWSRSIAIDSNGNAHVTGQTESSNFPNTSGAYDTSHNGHRDVFVTKLNPTGSALIYSTFIGGSGQEDGFSIAIDSKNNAHVTGWT